MTGSEPKSPKWVLLLTILVSIIAVGYIAKGLYHLVLDTGRLGAIDLRSRWQEQHYVLRHKNYFEVRDRWEAAGYPLMAASTVGMIGSPGAPGGLMAGIGIFPGRDDNIASVRREVGLEPDLDVPQSPGYPPWTWLAGTLFMWPSNWTAVRYYYAACLLLALTVIGLQAARYGRVGGRSTAALFFVAAIAPFSIHSTMGLGQYGIVVLTFLLGALWCDEHQRPFLCGLLMGIALLKPTLSLPFLIPLLVKQRWLSLVTAGLYVCCASGFTWWMTGTDPLTMTREMFAASNRWGVDTGVDIVAFLSTFIPRDIAMKVTALSVVAVSLVVMYCWRRASMLTLFGVAAVTARLWSYHRGYDDLIGVFVMLALGAAAWEQESKLGKLAFVAMGFTLWVPARLLGFGVGLLLLVSWVGCTIILLRLSSRQGHAGAAVGVPRLEF
jgi:hypothetical protein